MEQPWWVYGSVALGCAILFCLAKVVEQKFMKEDDDLDVFVFIIGFIGILAAYKTAVTLNLFS